MNRRVTVLLSLALSFWSCAPRMKVPGPEQLQAWVVYFDAARGLAELEANGALFDRVSLFAYELDSAGAVAPAPGMAEMVAPFLDMAQQHGFEPWVTVVNDVRHGSDSAIPKDPTVVHELMNDAERRSAHAREIALKSHADGFRGLHLDYEQLPESDSLAFRLFAGELHAELTRLGLGFEVVLEPSNGPLPERREQSVVVMAYDLFGVHSGPGPRSTPAFITELGPRGSYDADSAPGLAVAVGGFVWDSGGEAEAVDWSRAHQFAGGAERVRRAAGDRVPSVLLADGRELYFDDRESVIGKWEAAWRAGFRRLAVWRLGGNDENFFELLRDLRR